MLSVRPVYTQSTVLLREDPPSYSVQHIFKSSSGLRKHLAQSRPEKKTMILFFACYRLLNTHHSKYLCKLLDLEHASRSNRYRI